MLLQKVNTTVDAIEINEDAATQARNNISLSPWCEKIIIHHQSLQEFVPRKKYDFIFSNPPFFKNDLKSIDQSRNQAMHESILTLDFLIDFISLNLSINGIAALLIPYNRIDELTKILVKNNLQIISFLMVKQTSAHDVFRAMVMFSKINLNILESDIISIKDISGDYTNDFKGLLQDYYLHL
jgi:tRNA1Val (adenine37-N6)-methyltransferase